MNNPRVLGDKSLLAHIALNGFTGPIAGKTYTGGVMLALKSNDDKYIAAALTYIRNSWGNKAVMVTPQDIAKVRRKTSSVTGPYTEKTIRKVMLNSGDDIKLWKLSATKGQKYLPNLQDDDLKNTYATKSQMKKGFYIQADFPHERKISRVILQAKGNDFPKALKVEISTDGKTWQTVAAKVKGKRTTVVSFPTTIATKLRVTCLEDKKSWWQLYDFKIPTPQK